MKFKTNLIIGIVFLGLLSFVYFYEIKGGEARKKEAAKAKELLRFEAGEVRRLVIERRDTTVVLEKKENEWQLRTPVVDAADRDAVERYLRNLQETERERVIADSAAVAADPDLVSRYGLAEPRLKVWLEIPNGSLDTLAFGADTPTEQFTYGQRRGANREVFAVRAWRFDNLNKGAFDLRDRRVLAFKRDEVMEIRLTRPQGRIVLAKEGEEWRLKDPFAGLADKNKVDELLNRLQNARIEAFVVEQPTPDDLLGRGLGSPTATEVSLLVGQDRAEKRLQVGGLATEGNYFARDASRPQIFQVDSTLVRVLHREATEWRDRKPLRFERNEVVRIELRRPERVIAATKDTAGVWTIVEPETKKAKSWKWNELLTELQQVEVDSFVAGSAVNLTPYGLGSPRLVVRLLGDAGELLEVQLGKGSDGRLYLRRGGDPQIYQVDAEVLQKLDLELNDLAEGTTEGK